jgi:hypothetical protein
MGGWMWGGADERESVATIQPSAVWRRRTLATHKRPSVAQRKLFEMIKEGAVAISTLGTV